MLSAEIASRRMKHLSAQRMSGNVALQEAYLRHLTERLSLAPVERLAASGRLAASNVQDVCYASADIAQSRLESAGRHVLVAWNMQNSRPGDRPGSIRKPNMWRIQKPVNEVA